MLPTYVLPLHQPAPPAPPTLTVNAKGRVYLSKALVVKLRIRIDQPIDLLPPSSDCPTWQLDLRPTARYRICWYENTRPRITCVYVPAGLLEPGTKLLLALTSMEPTSPGLYQLNLVTTLI